MRPVRPVRLLAVVLALAAMAWLLRPDARAPSIQPPATSQDARVDARPGNALPGFLPEEAGPVIRRIQAGGTFPHRQDGSVFGNRERHLPVREHGWYREYTVPTPGLSHRGARRIVTGGDPPREWYYTADHYDSFRAFQPPVLEAGR